MTTTAWRLEGYERLDSRARWALVVLAAIAVVDVVAVGADLLEWRLVDNAENGVLTVDEADANDLRQAVIGSVQLAGYLVGAIFFIRWLHRAYVNLKALGAEELRYRTGWAIGAWFVPILNLFRPKQIVNDVWRASSLEAPPEQGARWRNGPIPPLLTAWWLIFLVANWLGNVGAGRFGTASAEDVKANSLSWAVADGLDAVAAVLAILVVRALTARQEARAEKLAGEPIERG